VPVLGAECGIEKSLIDAKLMRGERSVVVKAIHSDNSGNEENIVFIKDINNAIKSIDVLLISPSLGTGVDMSQYHFGVIFGVFHGGSQAATECLQQLWRYRPNVPMHVWVAPRPPFGYAETNVEKIKQRILERNELTAFLIRIDPKTGRRGAERDWALDAYCLIEAQRNASMNNLRADVRSLLESMGNTIIEMGDETDKTTSAALKAVQQVLDIEYHTAIAKAKDIDKQTYEARQHQDYLSPQEQMECEKYRIQDSYGMMEVTPELVEKDRKGQLIRNLTALEAILAEPGETITDELGRSFPSPPLVVVARDLKERERLKICTDWSNHSTAWLMRHWLGLGEILKALMGGEKIKGDEPMMLNLAEKSHLHAVQIKAILNITIPPNKSPMWILGQFLTQLGLSTLFRRLGKRGQRYRCYYLNPEDVAFAQQVLAHRQQQRENRERKRLEQEQKNAAHAARMRVMYGVDEHSLVSTPPRNVEHKKGGMDTNSQNETWWSRVRDYAHLLMEGFEYGIETIKELLTTLTADERWGVMLEWENLDFQGFTQFIELRPDWMVLFDLL
jgi:hypothetical protein